MEVQMPRLFIAVDLPVATTAELVLIQPPGTAGIRLAEPGQMHLTLQYIGEADAERLIAALGAVAFPTFLLAFEGVGQFPSAGDTVTLWAGVRESPELLGLAAALAAALTPEGFRPEARRYTPHVTLARCGPEVPAHVVEGFLARHAAFSLPPMPVTAFGLYSSAFVGAAPVYRRECCFPLLSMGSQVR
jgi:2'-5' RNA ligase